ncbi:MAG: AAA family ATPase [Caulobacter sp.]|nr:AAA family ATPase [Caulobacter sp.]
MARFYVQGERRGLQTPPLQPSSWLLRSETVEDNGFRTTFRLFRVDSRGELNPVGTVKIIRKGMMTGRPSLNSSFDELGPNYASLGAELDYYRNLKDIAGAEARDVLKALGDIATDPARRHRFAEDPGYEASLLRFSPARAALKEAADIFNAARAPRERSAASLTFNTSTGGAGFSVDFDFEVRTDIPGRINVIVGANGSGKTRLLANLAMAAFDSPEGGSERPWGTLKGNPFLSRVLAFSYSAFDDFDVPGANANQRSAFLGQDSSLGYRYFGLRNLAETRSGNARASALKTSGQISYDFRNAVERAIDEEPALFVSLLNNLMEEPSFGSAGIAPARLDKDLRSQLDRIFSASSTGHKFVLLMISQLVAHVRDGSLVLVDEPEAHLHPPLLATFLKVLRQLLDAKDSHAIIATHSPFVVQETPARYVRVVTRYVNRTAVESPRTETFGEDIGTVSREVFRLDSRRGEFVSILQDLASRYSLESLENLFEGGMSSQARALVIAIQARAGTLR